MKYFQPDQMTGTLTASTSTAALLQIGGAVVPTDFQGAVVGCTWQSTAGSPDGLLSIDFFDAASNGSLLGSFGADDLGTDDMGIDILASPVPFFSGIWFQVTGDSDSNGDGYAFTPILVQLEP